MKILWLLAILIGSTQSAHAATRAASNSVPLSALAAAQSHPLSLEQFARAYGEYLGTLPRHLRSTEALAVMRKRLFSLSATEDSQDRIFQQGLDGFRTYAQHSRFEPAAMRTALQQAIDRLVKTPKATRKSEADARRATRLQEETEFSLAAIKPLATFARTAGSQSMDRFLVGDPNLVRSTPGTIRQAYLFETIDPVTGQAKDSFRLPVGDPADLGEQVLPEAYLTIDNQERRPRLALVDLRTRISRILQDMGPAPTYTELQLSTNRQWAAFIALIPPLPNTSTQWVAGTSPKLESPKPQIQILPIAEGATPRRIDAPGTTRLQFSLDETELSAISEKAITTWSLNAPDKAPETLSLAKLPAPPTQIVVLPDEIVLLSTGVSPRGLPPQPYFARMDRSSGALVQPRRLPTALAAGLSKDGRHVLVISPNRASTLEIYDTRSAGRSTSPLPSELISPATQASVSEDGLYLGIVSEQHRSLYLIDDIIEKIGTEVSEGKGRSPASAPFMALGRETTLAQFGDAYRGYVHSLPSHLKTEAALAALRAELFALPAPLDSNDFMLQQGFDGLARFARMRRFSPDEVRAAIERVIDESRAREVPADAAIQKDRIRDVTDLHPEFDLSAAYGHSRKKPANGGIRLFAADPAQFLELRNARTEGGVSVRRFDAHSNELLGRTVIPLRMEDLLEGERTPGTLPDTFVSVDTRTQQVVFVDLPGKKSTPLAAVTPGLQASTFDLSPDARWISYLKEEFEYKNADAAVTIISRANPGETREFREQHIEDLRFSRDGTEIAIWNGAGRLKIWNLDDPAKSAELYVLPEDLEITAPHTRDYVVTRDQVLFFIQYYHHSKVIRLDRKTGQFSEPIQLPVSRNLSHLTPDGRYVIYVPSASKEIHIFDLHDRAQGRFAVGRLQDTVASEKLPSRLSRDGQTLVIRTTDAQGAERSVAYRMSDILSQLRGKLGDAR
jgi:hypothetical protein